MLPLVVIVMIAGLGGWLFFAGRRPDERLAQSRADHPSSGTQSSSVHVVHLGDDGR